MERQRQRILFLTPQLPYPPRQGTSIRNYNLIRFLASHHHIDLVSFLAPGDRLADDSPLRTLCACIVTVPQPNRSTRDRILQTFTAIEPDMGLRLYSPAMLDELRTLQLNQYDIVQVEGIEMAPYSLYIRELMKETSDPPAIVFDDHNCEFLLQKRNALTDLHTPKRWPAAAYSVIQWQKLRHYERKACLSADLVLAVSEPDRQALQKLTNLQNISLVPNGIDTDAYQNFAVQRAISAKPTIVFTGKMDYRPNIDAALWFAEQVFPFIREMHKDAVFQIVGQQPHSRLEPLRNVPGIEITGEVPEIEPYLANAAVFVIPMRIGGGTRLKALQAMAAGLPIVTTSLGIEGIAVTDGKELLIRDEPQAFAQAVNELTDDRQNAGIVSAQLGERARAFVADTYDWRKIVPRLEQSYLQLSASRQEAQYAEYAIDT